MPDLDFLEQLLNNASTTPRPWHRSTDQPSDVVLWGPPSPQEPDASWIANLNNSIEGECNSSANADLIVGAVNALWPLIAEIRHLRSIVEQVRVVAAHKGDFQVPDGCIDALRDVIAAADASCLACISGYGCHTHPVRLGGSDSLSTSGAGSAAAPKVEPKGDF